MSASPTPSGLDGLDGFEPGPELEIPLDQLTQWDAATFPPSGNEALEWFSSLNLEAKLDTQTSDLVSGFDLPSSVSELELPSGHAESDGPELLVATDADAPPLDSAPLEPSQATTHWAAGDASPRELVFVDAMAEDREQLVADLLAQRTEGRNLDVVLLDPERDGVSQISETLSNYRDLDAIHLVTHGSAGEINLGNNSLSSGSLDALAGELAGWSEAFSLNGDLLIYGCDVAANADGRDLIDAIAALCDCDVMASDDLTGNAAWGGDWDFEYVAGAVEANVAFSVDLQDSWNGVLAATAVTPGVELNTNGGNDAYLQAEIQGIVAGQDAITYEVSLQTSTPNAEYALAHYAIASQDDEFVVEVTAGNDVRLSIGGIAVTTSNFDAIDLADDTIHSLAVSWDNTNGDWKVYFDGELTDYGTGLQAGHVLGASGAFVIGQEQDVVGGSFDPLEFFSGTLHDVRIWDDVRGAEEISLNHQHKFDDSNLPSGLVANWRMQGIDGSSQVSDAVGANALDVLHTAQAGFTAGTSNATLNVDEDASFGTIVGIVSPFDNDAFNDVVNDGQFLEAGIPATTQDYTGVSSMGGWTVVQNDVTLLGDSYERTPLGGMGVDLNGHDGIGDSDDKNVPGIIEQTLTTEVGQEYTVTFALSGDWTGGDSAKDLRVTAGGTANDFNVMEPNSWSPTNMVWAERSFTFTATATNTQLRFESLDSVIDYGPVIGDVQVIETPPAIQAMLASDPTLTYNAATGKFYRTSATTELWASANSISQASTLNGVAGNLASVGSEYENELLRLMADAVGTDIWIGATDQTTEGDFYWQDSTGDGEQFWTGGNSGTALAFENWKSAPRDPGTGEDYVVLEKGSGDWLDFGDGVNRYYVTEWDASEVLGSRTFAMSDPSNNFQIDPTTGRISLSPTSTLNYEAATSHSVDVVVTSPGGGTFLQAVTIVVNDVDDAPVVTLPATPASYVEGDVPTVLAATATVTDPDSADFDTGSLTVAWVAGGTADDRLSLRHEGFALGQVGITGLTGADVTYGGVVVGTWTGGSDGTTPLVVTFNASANGSAVEAVTQHVTYFNVSDTIDTTPRQISVQVDDGDGNTSVASTMDINITAVQDAPIALNDRHGITFDGVDDYVLVNDSPSLTMTNTMTMEAWVNPDVSTNTVQMIVNKEGEYEMAIFADGSLNWGFDNAAPGWSWHDTGVDIPTGQWTHLAVSYDNGVVSTYVNGNLVEEFHGSGPIDDSHLAMNTFRIGGRENSPAGQYFDGQIGEVRVWNTARSQAAIRADLGATLSGAEAGLAGYWKFDEARGSIANDSTANGNNGMLGGGVLAESPSWNGFPITEDAVLNVAAAGVLATDIDPDGDTLTVTELNNDPTAIGSPTPLASGALVTLNANGSFTYDTNGAFDALGAGQSTTDTFTYTVDDGNGNTDTATVTINITGIEDDPTFINLDGDTLNYTGGDGAVVVEQSGDALVTDVDSADFDTGALTVTIVAGGVGGQDVLGIHNQGVAAGEIGVSGSSVTFGGTTFGTFSGGSGGVPLVVTFDGNATPQAVSALAQNITYENTDPVTPTTGVRNLSFVVTDGDGGTSAGDNVTVNVSAKIGNPVVSFASGDISYTENSLPIIIDSSGTVTDVDSVDFDTGTLTVSLTNSESDDRLTIRDQGTAVGQIGVSGTDVTYNFGAGAVVIGSYAGGSGATPLVLTFNANATPVAAEALLHNLEFSNLSEDPSTVGRSVQIVLTDGDGGTSAPAVKTINVAAVNDDSTLSLSGVVNYTENDPATWIAPSATVADVDSGDFDGGELRVRLTVGGEITDRLAIQSVGTGPGQVSLTGSTVYYEGIAVGVMSGGGDGFTPLIVNFNASATSVAVEAVVQSVTFENLSEAPTNARDFDVRLTDGDGGTVVVNETIALTAVNDAPFSQVPAATLVVAEDGVLTLSSASSTNISISDVDAGASTMRVTLSATNGSLDLATTVGLTFVSGDGTNAVTLEGAATDLNAALDGLTFTPVPDFYGAAVIAVDMDDLGNSGSGGPLTDSDVVNISVTPVNDDPTLTLSGSVSYTENTSPTLLAPTATLADIDSTDFDTGTLAVVLTSGGTANDRIALQAVGNGVGEVNVSGSNVLYEGVVVGSFVGGGDGATPLVVTFNSNATVAATEAVTQSITYENVSDAPTSSRTFDITVTDGDGGSVTVGESISIAATNDAPWNQVPSGPLVLAEDTVLTLSSANSSNISIADLDAGVATMQVTLTATNGVLNLATTAGLAFVSGDGSSTVTLAGATADINTALDGLTYSPTPDYYGAATITVDTTDLGNSGLGGPLVDSDVINLTVTPVNDDPTLTLSGSVGYVENAAPTLLAPTATLSDIDSVDFDAGTLTVALSGGATSNDRLAIRPVGNGLGEVNLSSSDVLYEGVVVGAMAGGTDGATPLVVTFNSNATEAAVEAVTQSVTYENLSDAPTSNRTFDVTVTDGDGGSVTVSESISIAAVNDAPWNQMPVGPLVVAEDGVLTLSSATGDNISISDLDAVSSTMRVTLTATNGSLNLATTAGLTLVSGDGASVVTLEGVSADINAALDGLTFSPSSNYYGPATIAVDTSDLGNTGSGGVLVDSDMIYINITSVNDAPWNLVPGPLTMAEDSVLTLTSAIGANVTVADVDATSLRVSLTAANGVLNLATTVGLTSVTGNGSAVVVMEGDAADLNTALDGMTFTSNADYYGAASVTVVTEDLGGSGAGGPLSDTDVIDISVTPVNDAPTSSSFHFQTSSLSTLDVTTPGLLDAAADVDGDPLSVVLLSPPAFGALTFNPDGSFTYDPIAVFQGTVTFTFAATDGSLQSAPSTVSIEVLFVGAGVGDADGDGDGDLGTGVVLLPTDSDSDDSGTDVIVLLAPPQVEVEAEPIELDLGANAAYRDRGAEVPQFIMKRASTGPMELETVATQYFVSATSVSTEMVETGISRLNTHTAKEFAYERLLWSQLDALADSLRGDTLGGASYVAGTAKVATSVMIAGYAAWSLRAGYAAAWLTSSMPTWVRFDPLPVLQSALPIVRAEDGESLAEIARG